MKITLRSEAYICLAEECAEVAQSITKIIRFGENTMYNGESNLSALHRELGDLFARIDQLELDMDWIEAAKMEKLEKILKSDKTSLEKSAITGT